MLVIAPFYQPDEGQVHFVGDVICLVSLSIRLEIRFDRVFGYANYPVEDHKKEDEVSNNFSCCFVDQKRIDDVIKIP